MLVLCLTHVSIQKGLLKAKKLIKFQTEHLPKPVSMMLEYLNNIT